MHGITKFLKNKLLRGSNQAKISMIDVHTMTRNIHTKIKANLCSIMREAEKVKNNDYDKTTMTTKTTTTATTMTTSRKRLMTTMTTNTR